MSHPKEDLSAYVSGELDAHQRIDLEAHLQECRQCADELQDLERLDHLLSKQELLEPSSGFLSGVLQKLDGQRKLILFRSRRALLALAAVVAFFAILISLQHEPKHPQLSVDNPPLIERPKAKNLKIEAPPPFEKPVETSEEAEMIAQMETLEDMDLIEDYDSLQDPDVAILMNNGEVIQ